MEKRLPFNFLLIWFLIYGVNNEIAVANSEDSPPSYEEFLPEIGYKTVEAALKEFEQHFKQELKLPLRIPPIPFTHQFGRFSNSEGDMNDAFEMKMISDLSPKNHFKINVRPIEHKIPFEKYVSKLFLLDNGQEAGYIEHPGFGFNMLVFERDNWQYVFSISKEVSCQVTAEVLVQIANSIDYPAKKSI